MANSITTLNKKIKAPKNNNSQSTSASSVARVGGGGGGLQPPHWPVNQNAESEKTTFLALLRLLFVLEWTKKWLKPSFETYIQGGLICQK